MSIDLNDSIETLILALANSIEDIESCIQPFILEQDTEPQQIDWEAAWLAAGNSLPISEDQELYWKSGENLRGQFGRTNDRFYCIFPSNSVSLAGVVHFAYTKFLGWEDDQHFLFSGTQLNDAGQYIGLLRGYLDGSCEQVDFTGFTANTLLGYDEAQGKLWYIEGTDLKRIDTTTEVITVIAGGITVAPTSIAFDGAGDAFCTINIGAGLDLYRWNNGAATFTSFKASITVNGVGEDPGQVICASLNYVVVLSSVSNYWVQIARAGGAETQIKSNPAGATGDNLPQPDATAWVQSYAGKTLDVLKIVYTELTGSPALAEWRRTFNWNMATASYTEIDSLPYDDFIAMCLSQAPNPDPLNYDARRDINYHTLTSAYRKRVGAAWEYHNISGVRCNNDNSRMLFETDDGQIFIWANGSSGKIWRISQWEQGESDAIVLGVVDITGDSAVYQIMDISDRPGGYDLIELSIQNGITALDTQNYFSKKVGASDFNNISSNQLYPSGAATTHGGGGLRADSGPTYSGTQQSVLYASAANGQSMAKVFFILPDGDAVAGLLVIGEDIAAPDAAGTLATFNVHAHFLDSDFYPVESVGLGFAAARSWIGQYIMVRALRTDPRRRGGAYYDPAMA